jgi:hypothetical protein
MKEKIVAALKAKYPKLSDARINAYADKLVAKITDEKDIDLKIDDLNDVVDFQSIVKSDEKIAKLEAEKKAAAKKKPEAEKVEGEGDQDEEADESDGKGTPKKERVPAWAKSLIDSNKKLTDDLARIQSEKSQTTIKQKAAEKLKDIPEIIWGKRPLPENEDGLDAFVTEVNADYEVYAKQMADKGFAGMGKPKGGEGGDATKASTQEVDAILDKIKF